MKNQFMDFLHQLSLYDYLLFGGILFLFLLTLFLAIFFHHKLKLAVTLIILSFIILTAGPPVGYLTLHYYLYKHSINLTTVRDLQFTDALVLRGEIKNISKLPINNCTLYVGVAKKSPYAILNRLYPYIPFRRKTVDLDLSMKPGESHEFKILIEPFHYSHPHTVTVKGICQ